MSRYAYDPWRPLDQLKPGDVLRLRDDIGNAGARSVYESGDIVVLKKHESGAQWTAFCPRLGKDTPVNARRSFWEKVDG